MSNLNLRRRPALPAWLSQQEHEGAAQIPGQRSVSAWASHLISSSRFGIEKCLRFRRSRSRSFWRGINVWLMGWMLTSKAKQKWTIHPRNSGNAPSAITLL